MLSSLVRKSLYCWKPEIPMAVIRLLYLAWPLGGFYDAGGRCKSPHTIFMFTSKADMHMKVKTAATIEYTATICWAAEPFVSPEMAWTHFKKNTHVILIKVFNISLRPKWLTRTSRRTLATRNELYHDCTHLPLGLRYRRFPLARSRANSLRNYGKVMFEWTIATHMTVNKM